MSDVKLSSMLMHWPGLKLRSRRGSPAELEEVCDEMLGCDGKKGSGGPGEQDDGGAEVCDEMLA